MKKENTFHRGLFVYEWVAVGYMLLTTLLIAVFHTRLVNPESMLLFRGQFLLITVALWGVYRMVPCRLMVLVRASVQMALLGTWYPDTYEFNRILPNLDHVFASLEQSLFSSQPALWLHETLSSPVVSELLELGYVSYYPLMVVVMLFYFFRRYADFHHMMFVLMGAFFAFYCIFIFVPVAGPQYYYEAIGVDQAAQGIFPNIGNYFETHQESLPIPGWKDGLMYKALCLAHDAGERPTAAFPSSHVGIATVLLFLAWRTGNRRLFWGIFPFAFLMFFATFYIQAHYVVDAIAGLIVGALLYFALDKAIK